ncbi:MAG: phosphoglucosamine mutase [Thermodesulfobacteriota bacterium]
MGPGAETVKEEGSAPRKLFGTDGIRGIANVEPMTVETAMRIGRGTAYLFKGKTGHRPKIVIGKDTRLSGYMLENAIASGVCSMGVDVLLVGPLPTPGIAFITRSMRADAGVVISASHNPFQDNGIKIFSSDGFKLPDELEARIEALVSSNEMDLLRPTAQEVGKAFRVDDAKGRYIVFLKSSFPAELTLEGMKVIVDCANGAAYKVAPLVLEELGARVIPLGVEPNGENINKGCGALHAELICKVVRQEGADLGIALDGDGDRAVFCDEKGRMVDGDRVMAMAALDLDAKGRLNHRTVVSTVMSNMGLEVALRRRQIRLIRTAVGDRYVVEEMQRGGFNLGGEQSGHILFLDHTTTGDGIITALQVMSLMCRKGRPLSELSSVMESYPQVLRNIPVRDRRPVEEISGLPGMIRRAQERLGDEGRILIRYSGTEPFLRVMVEGQDDGLINLIASDLEEVVRKSIGLEA